MIQKKSGATYKLMVLMDLSKASETALKNTIALSKAIDGSIEVFHVKAPTDVVKSENQLSAIRVIHEDKRNTKSKLEKLINTTSDFEGVPIEYKMSYGNIKSTIKSHIDKIKPDIVVLGKEKPKLINFLSDDLIGFLLNETDCHLFITGDNNTVYTNKDISLGIYGNLAEANEHDMIDSLKKLTTQRIKHFSVRGAQEESQKEKIKEGDEISYVFSEGSNAIDGLATYFEKTRTQLLCITKKQSNDTLFQSRTCASVKPLLRKLKIPVLILR